MNKYKEKFDLYQLVTGQIIEILENHVNLNFTASWTPKNGEILAGNPVSGTTYRGFNQLYLCYVAQKRNYTQNRWITLKQGNARGGKVKKGQKGQLVTFWKRLYKDEKTGRNITNLILSLLKERKPVPVGVKTIPLLRYYVVFNLEQFEELPEELFFKGETLSFEEPEKDELAEEYLTATGAKIKHVTDAGNCYYPLKDYIQLCDRDQFRGKEAFYRTAFHELGHWTGHNSRLDRNLINSFGSAEYAKEELVAELYSAFVSASLGFSSEITNNAAYIQSWLGALRRDKKYIFSASGAAQKAADFTGELVENKIAVEPGVAEIV